MNILVRNEEHVSECVLLPAGDLPYPEVLKLPQVRKLIGGRRITSISYGPSKSFRDPIIVDLTLQQPR